MFTKPFVSDALDSIAKVSYPKRVELLPQIMKLCSEDEGNIIMATLTYLRAEQDMKFALSVKPMADNLGRLYPAWKLVSQVCDRWLGGGYAATK